MNKYDYFFLVGLGIWAIETIAFGFNDHAASNVEKMLDILSLALLLYGAVCGLASAIKSEVHIHGKDSTP